MFGHLSNMLVEKLQRVASGGGTWVLWVMVFLSIWSMAVIFERAIFYWLREDNIEKLSNNILKALRCGDRKALVSTLNKSKSVEASIIYGTLDWIEEGTESFEEAVEAEVGKKKLELDKGMNFLGTLGNNAPFIGLLGTVLGVIQSFQALGGGQNKEAMANVMVGISEALVATGVGLFVALPAVIAFNILNKKSADIEANVHIISKQILAFLKSDSRKIDYNQEEES
jgi:biopolymer transport protein ExbB/TolQ